MTISSAAVIAVAEGKLFVTTPYAKVYALDAKTGDFIWEAQGAGPDARRARGERRPRLRHHHRQPAGGLRHR